MQLILASTSPRRRELLGYLGLPFAIRAGEIDETMDPQADPYQEVGRISRKKALAVPREPDELVIGADTIVVCQGRILGKPHSRDEAVQMLRLLSGRSHQVMTGCTLVLGETCRTFTEVTELWFRPLSQREIDRYCDTPEPMDKAGAYAIQGVGALFCQRLVGDYYNVMGLPLCRLVQELKEMGEYLL